MADRIRTILGHLSQGTKNTKPEPFPVSGVSASSDGQFRYTVDQSRLTYEQRKFYEENGYLVIKRLVPEDKLNVYRERFKEICTRKVKIPLITIMRDVAITKSEYVEGEQAVTKVQNFENDDVLFGYCCLPEVVQYVECFTGPDVVSMHTMLINKPPDSGKKSSRHPLHQDLHYFPFRPAERIVCSWTAMEPVHRQNGCLVVLPGTHKGPLLQHEYPEWEGGVNMLYHGIRDFDPNSPRLHLEMGPGDTVFFHPLLIHGSGMNRTTGFRKSISCHYASGKCSFVDLKGTMQEKMADELVDLISEKHGIPRKKVSIQDLWHLKSRPVKGEATLLQRQ